MSVSCAVLLDRDGTLIEDKHYLSEPSGVALLPGVGPALSRLVQAGHRLFLVSNQSGVGRGYFTEQAVVACQKRLEELLEPYGVAFTDAVWCPHAPEESCFCRKPLPGMFDELRARHGLLPETTFMIGDKLDDLGFAANAGLSAGLLVLSGKGAEHARKAGYPVPVSGIVEVPGAPRRVVAADFESAVAWIVRDIENRGRGRGGFLKKPFPPRTLPHSRKDFGLAGRLRGGRTCRMCGAGGIESPDVQSGHKKEPCVAARLFFMCSAAGSGFSLDQSEADEHFPEILP